MGWNASFWGPCAVGPLAQRRLKLPLTGDAAGMTIIELAPDVAPGRREIVSRLSSRLNDVCCAIARKAMSISGCRQTLTTAAWSRDLPTEGAVLSPSRAKDPFASG